jgi:hypothetical protein
MQGITGFRLRRTLPAAHVRPVAPVHDWNTCTDETCADCQALVNDGTIMACDECGRPGHTDAPGGWVRAEDGMIFCEPCAATLAVVPT